MVKKLLALAAVGTVWASPARADFFFDNYCVTGAFPVCASVRVFSTPTKLTIQVWNLNGTFGVPHTLTAIGLYHSGSPFTGTLSNYRAYHVTGSGTTDITGKWVLGSQSINTLAGIQLEAATGTNTGHQYGIVGCTDPGPASANHISTCQSFPGTPYVQFEFNTSTQFSTNNLQLRWHSQQVAVVGSLKCDTGGAGNYPPCEVVPEPITMVLLGTGLAGLGGSGMIVRRRRKKNGEESLA